MFIHFLLQERVEGLGITLPVSQSVVVFDSAHASEYKVSLGSPRSELLQCGFLCLLSLAVAYLGQVYTANV